MLESKLFHVSFGSLDQDFRKGMREHSATETQRYEASKAVTKPPTLSAGSRGVYRFFLRDFRSVE